MQLTPGSEDQLLGQKHDSVDQQAPNDVQVVQRQEVIDTEVDSQRKVTTPSQKEITLGATPDASKDPGPNVRKKTPIVNTEALREAFTEGVCFAASYTFSMSKSAIKIMRGPLYWILILYMLAWLASRITPVIRIAFSPLCTIPAISSSSLCVPLKPSPLVDFEKLVHSQGSTFEKLVGETAGSSQLAMGVLRAEVATRDRSVSVRSSSFKSKDSIADLLDTIAADAKRTGRGLIRLDARVIGAIDEMVTLNNYAKVTIGDAHKMAPSPLMQAVSPLKLGPTVEEIVTETFIVAMDQSEQVIGKLIQEAEASLQNFEQLDVDIAVLHDMVMREEDTYTREQRDEPYWAKWGKPEDYEDHLALLENLEEYKKMAVPLVKAAMRELYIMSDDLEVLRDRVAAPGLLGNKVPLHVHMDNIQKGLERLQEGCMASRGQRITYDETVRILAEDGSKS